ncbi:MAG: hypothetical protein V1861_06485 [Candidatus Micrarchaeota archaeon]
MTQAQDFPLISHSPKRWAEFVRTRTPILESMVPLDWQGRRDWKMLGDKELVAHANLKRAGDGITSKKELRKADKGLYEILRRRKQLDGLGLENRFRDWARMGDAELAAYAKTFIAGERINGRGELSKSSPMLYDILRRRELLESVGLVRKRSDWMGMGSAGLVAYAEGFIAERGIRGKKGLEKEYGGLYMALKRRKLLDAVFSDSESSKHAEAVEGVLDALESFGDDQ